MICVFMCCFPKEAKMNKQKQMATKKKKQLLIRNQLLEPVCLQTRRVSSTTVTFNHLYRCPSLHSEPEAASGPTAAPDTKDEPAGPEGSPGQ